MLKASRAFKFTTLIIGILLFSLFLYFLNSSTRFTHNNQNSTSYVKYEKAEVLVVENESLKSYPNATKIYLGTQQIKIKILTGEHKGDIKTITNFLSDTHNVYVNQGMKIIVDVDTGNPNMYAVTVYNYYRAPIQYVFILIFFVALCLIGGKKGVRSAIGILISFVLIFYMFLPIIYRGYSPILASILLVIISSCVTLFLLNGWSAKTVSAILGTILGVFVAGSIATLICNLAHLSGFNMADVESLNMISTQSNMQVQWLLTAGILISSLGAVMDVSISIASSVQEIYSLNPKLTEKELFISGMNVGRDMMGTMVNTLILAFAGTSLSMFIVIYSYNLTNNQLFNMDMVNIVVLEGLTGSFAVILTVPIIAYISSQLIPDWIKNEKKKDIVII
ncbi:MULTISPECIES: YibE/F family protein [Clostridium]|uniref:YibE/F family protein n=1 Tax=Clostridium frigoriphilum TaxID=443253 RepID=A0ABU7UWQ2_9CLOT|nr:YibE/F family protein [Clostridium sp. DSM 17811]MBU3102220.1 YibE/F family protein [Clostridium sp. DSM 17811]